MRTNCQFLKINGVFIPIYNETPEWELDRPAYVVKGMMHALQHIIAGTSMVSESALHIVDDDINIWIPSGSNLGYVMESVTTAAYNVSKRYPGM